MRNYAYAALESQVRVAIAEAGLDPSIGYLHVCQPGWHALVYDLMEPYRPQADGKVLALLRSQTFTPRDFVIDARGVCRLHANLAQLVVTTRSGISPTAITDIVRYLVEEPLSHS